jgi:hypothetical protein
MKQVDLVRLLLRKGVVFVRHGANHDWYKNPLTGISEAIPRHREIVSVHKVGAQTNVCVLCGQTLHLHSQMRFLRKLRTYGPSP